MGVTICMLFLSYLIMNLFIEKMGRSFLIITSYQCITTHPVCDNVRDI